MIYFQCELCKGLWFILDKNRWQFLGFSPITSKDKIIQLNCQDCDKTIKTTQIFEILRKEKKQK